jgi:hypothetical protein
MKTNLPPIIEDWLNNLSNKNIPINIRYNYFNMINNVIQEMQKASAAFQKELDKQHTR